MTGGPAAVHALLRSALPHVPSKGFSLAAIRVAVEESVLLKQKAGEETATPTNVDRALERLFPGPDTAPTSGPRRLFAAWDQEAGTQMVSDAKTAFGADPKNNHDAFQGSVELLSDRLCASAVVQPHLLPVRSHLSSQAFTLLSSEPLLPLPSLVQRLGLSPRTVPFTGSLPNPGPLLQRYAALANQACFAAGMTGHHGVRCNYPLTTTQPEWYSLRARLATAYGAAELALATQPHMSLEQSTALLRRMADTPCAYESTREATHKLGQWVEWGGRGWLGIFRSFGL